MHRLQAKYHRSIANMVPKSGGRSPIGSKESEAYSTIRDGEKGALSTRGDSPTEHVVKVMLPPQLPTAHYMCELVGAAAATSASSNVTGSLPCDGRDGT